MKIILSGIGTAYAAEDDASAAASDGQDSPAGHAGVDSDHGADATHSETGVAHDEEHGAAFPPFDSSLFASQLLWLAISFGVFYLLMSRVIIPRIGGILETRSDRISQDLDEAQRLKEESEAAIAAYEHELAEAKNRAHVIGAEARDKAKAQADSERDKVEAELADKLAESEKTIAGIKEKALAEVDEIAATTAEAILSALVTGGAAKAEITRAVKSVSAGDGDV